MCISAATATMISAGISAASSVAQGFAQAGAAKSAQKAREQQQRADMELDQIAALDAENERQDQFSRLQAANLAAQGPAGLSDNLSFLKGVNAFNKEKALNDLSAIRFNSDQRQARAELAIRTDKASTKSRARNSIIGGIAGGVSSALQGYSAYKKVQVPGGLGDGGDFFSVGSAKAGGFTKFQ